MLQTIGTTLASPNGNQTNGRRRRAFDFERAHEDRRADGRNAVEMRGALDPPFVRAKQDPVRGGFLRMLHLIERERVYADSRDIALTHEKVDRLGRERRK